MLNFNSSKSQRAYINDKLKIPGLQLSPATLAHISSEVSFPHLLKLENEISLCEDQIALVNDEATSTRLRALTASRDSILDDIRAILKSIKTREGENAIRQAKAKELLLNAKEEIRQLSQKIAEEARTNSSTSLASLSTHLGALAV